MNQIQTFENVPAEKVDELVKNLQSEVPREAIEANRQADGKWLVRALIVDNSTPPVSGAAPILESNPSPIRTALRRNNFNP